ncbi:MAG: tetratricopeptide repeat protein [Bacteroidales bacterium]
MVRALLVVFMLIPGVLSGQSASELFREANDAYARSEYQHAAELYEQIAAMELVAPELFYNLGNSYFKSNRLGKAILNFERAARLNPADENIRHNLHIANSRTVDRIEQRPQLFYERWWSATYMLFSASGWAVLSIAVFVLLLAFVALYLFSRTTGVKKMAFTISAVCLVFFLFSLVFAQKQHNRLTNTSEAIIMVPRVAAKSSPAVTSPDLFLMHEGTKVMIRTRLGEWYEIALPNGNVGWIRHESIEVI